MELTGCGILVGADPGCGLSKAKASLAATASLVNFAIARQAASC